MAYDFRIETKAEGKFINSLNSSQIEDLRLASTKMTGAKRRSFQAEISIKYCGSNARRTEEVFGWGRENVKLGMSEKRTGITCSSIQPLTGGAKLWEEKHPEVAAELVKLAESHAQQDPTFQSTIAYTRLTAAAAIDYLKEKGYTAVPAASTMALILNRMGYRLRKVVKAKPQKK
jgi:Rhodopirellula transposase DDE domain